MKVEGKLSEFSADKWKWNGNMETETEFCGTKMETEFLRWKWKWNSVFRQIRRGNGISVSD
jgi:hypothetical protein